jgi:hypothetical protein
MIDRLPVFNGLQEDEEAMERSQSREGEEQDSGYKAASSPHHQ